jgi:polysaccharide deacetylase family protein (PEP-CTERM system associated)
MSLAARPTEADRGTFVLTFDFEDWHQLVHRRLGRPDWCAGGPEFGQHVSALLDFLDELGVGATFFVAGVAAERHPRALQEVVARGHEVACHGYLHRRAFQQTPREFREDVVRCVEVVERICGVEPIGYRAPWFSITRDSLWAHEILRELGFRYDSSLYDSPFVPRRIRPIPTQPFRVARGLDGGLWEFPIAVARWGRTVLPLGGGAYWRALPEIALWRGLENVARRSTFPVVYFHTYEWASEPLRVVLPAGASRRERVRETSRRLYKNARRDLIPVRIREAALRFRLVSFRDIVGADHDDAYATLLREAR